MLKSISRKAAFLVAIALATAVGGITTAVVMAAIPDGEGVIHGCYRSSGLLANGQTRIIDSATETCNTNETAVTWPSTAAAPTGPQVAYAAFNPDGTLDQSYTENIVDAKIVPAATDPNAGWPDNNDAACFHVAFEPRIASARYSDSVFVPTDRNVFDGTDFVDIRELIDDRCGVEFNAISLTHPEAHPISTLNFYFLR